MTQRPKSNPHMNVAGKIETANASVISGWVATVEETCLPLVFVNGRPMELRNWPKPRPDVNRALGLPGDMGFDFASEGLQTGDVITLYVFDGKAVHFVFETVAQTSGGWSNSLSQLRELQEIASAPDSVAITCWDGAHNPIGRAHVLYQTVTTQRPAIIVSYLFDEFGGALWPPLESSDFKRLLIPWSKRHEMFALLSSLDLSFPTIWMCKPRLPTFELAAALAGPQTRLILDHDDNEAHFSVSSSEDRVYGPRSLSLARHLQSGITAHTAASCSIAAELEAPILRHVRRAPEPAPELPAPSGVVKLGFVGTVRPHKGMIEAARAVKLAGWMLNKTIELHVYGIFAPETLRAELAELDVVVKHKVTAGDLQQQLAEFDVILTGFPTVSDQDSEITRYQISSKIGDGLAAGRPVLVPDGESVADLADVDGIYLFDRNSFAQRLAAAIRHDRPVRLPRAFTPEGAYDVFAQVEQEATTPPPQMPALRSGLTAQADAAPPTLVLIWKQYDAGLFGRRIDQVARGYKQRHPDHRVIVLELCGDHNHRLLQDNAHAQSHEAKIVLPLAEQKARLEHTDRFGVEYHALRFAATPVFKPAFTSYLFTHRLLPQNTKMVLFPVAPYLDRVYDILSEYRCVVDVVDNQFAWAGAATRMTYGGQYMSLLSLADQIVFNSQENLAFLQDCGFLDPDRAKDQGQSLIANWYSNGTGPSDRSDPGGKRNLIYSGNMNDRVDWGLMRDISNLSPDVTLHLVGAGARVGGQLQELLDRDNIVYWGPLPEQQVSQLMLGATAGLMPHVKDDVSTYMNPLKVQMYRAHGLPVVSTDVPGIDPSEVTLCDTRDSFLAAVRQLLDAPLAPQAVASLMEQTAERAQAAIDRYVQVIDDLGR